MSGVKPERKEIHANLTRSLTVHLANIYNLMLRLQNFHWNVTGPEFYSAHNMFEDYYKELWKEVDIVAERVRALGSQVPGTFEAFSELSLISNRPQPQDVDGMFEELITCSIMVKEHAEQTMKTAGLLVDEVTADILVGELRILEKAIWMFQSSLSRTEQQTGQNVVPIDSRKGEGDHNSSFTHQH